MARLTWAIPWLFLLWAVIQFTSLYCNYVRARRSGLPIIVAPFSPYSISWALFRTFFNAEKWFPPLIRFLLPESVSRFTRVVGMNWVREEGLDFRRCLGPAFFIVSRHTSSSLAQTLSQMPTFSPILRNGLDSTTLKVKIMIFVSIYWPSV